MLVNNNQDSLSQVLSKRYQESQVYLNKTTEAPEETSKILYPHHKIEDSFSPSQDYEKIKQARAYIKGAMKNTPSFLALADKLQRENLISQREKIAADFLAKKSPSLSFENFEAISKTQGINLEMQQTIRNLVQKLQMISYLNGNILA